MLYEIYRAEQYAFDGTGLAIAANNYNSSNAATDIAQQGINSLGGLLGKAVGSGVGDILGATIGGAIGLDPEGVNLIPKNIPSLAQYAFTVEMYYAGVVYRGYFKSMNITEAANDFNFRYDITFTATQKRGYRVNNFGWQRSPNVANAYDSRSDASLGHSFQRGKL
jgi:hypothetical protein